jgi:hypothetical protein
MVTKPGVLIFTVSKTGSTGLFYKILNSVGDGMVPIFEPKEFGRISWHLAQPKPLLVKSLMTPSTGMVDELLQTFSKRVFLVRDPRDRLVSWLLYTLGYESYWNRSEAEILRVSSLLRQKQGRPQSISVLEMCHQMNRGGQADRVFKMLGKLDKYLELTRQYPGFIFQYEDFIANRLNGLEQYLGFPLSGSTIVDAKYSNVLRSGGSGDWRHWFTEEDVKVLKTRMRNYMEGFGYRWPDWRLAATPQIEPIHAQEYLMKNINKRRQMNNLPIVPG